MLLLLIMHVLLEGRAIQLYVTTMKALGKARYGNGVWISRIRQGTLLVPTHGLYWCAFSTLRDLERQSDLYR